MRQGFTLIELSIVLVVIGLLVGGVLAGRSLIRNSELQGAIADVDGFKASVSSFKDKYNYFPGDLPTAKTFWPDNIPYTGFITANGDGDGNIAGTNPAEPETKRAWQHLSAAGMIAGQYDGGTAATLGVSWPVSRVPAAGYWIGHNLSGSPFSSFNSATVGHAFRLSTVYLSNMTGSAVSPQDAKYIDNKIDDGVPSTGSVLGVAGGPGFTNCENVSGADYVLTSTGINCTVYFTF